VSDILTESARLKYTQFRKNHGFLTFNLDDLSSLERFSNKIKTFVKQGNVYYVVAKVNYNTTDADTEKINENLDVFTPNQLAFDLRQTDSYDDEVRALYQDPDSQLNNLIAKYGFDINSIYYIQLMFRILDIKILTDMYYNPAPQIEPITKLLLDKQIRFFPLNNCPSIESKVLGDPISDLTIYNGIVTCLHICLGKSRIDFMVNLNKKQALLNYNRSGNKVFTSDTKFYFRNVAKNSYVLVINRLGDNKVSQTAYSLSGNQLSNVIDIKEEQDLVKRIAGNTHLTIKNNEIVSKSIEMSVPGIKPYNHKNDKKHINNPNIAVIDLETYIADDGTAKVFAAGLYCYGDIRAITIYINAELDCDDVISRLLEQMFKYKYSNYTFYCHNLGGFGSIFLIKTVYNLNQKLDDKPYSF